MCPSPLINLGKVLTYRLNPISGWADIENLADNFYKLTPTYPYYVKHGDIVIGRMRKLPGQNYENACVVFGRTGIYEVDFDQPVYIITPYSFTANDGVKVMNELSSMFTYNIPIDKLQNVQYSL